MEDDLNRLLTVISIVVVVLAYVTVMAWRLRVHRQKRAASAAPPPVLSGVSRLTRAQRKAAAITGTTPTPPADLSAAEARVLAAAARIAGHEPAPTDVTDSPDPDAGIVTDDTTPEPPAHAAAPTAVAPAPGPSLFRPSDQADGEPGARASTVADLLSGIHLPEELSPLTAMAPRAHVVDRVAFVAIGPPAEEVAPAFAAELQRLGFTMTPDGYDALVIERGPDKARVLVHREAGKAYIDGQFAFPATTGYAVVIEVWIPIDD